MRGIKYDDRHALQANLFSSYVRLGFSTIYLLDVSFWLVACGTWNTARGRDLKRIISRPKWRKRAGRAERTKLSKAKVVQNASKDD